MNKTMLFYFEHPIIFERIFNFNEPDHPFKVKKTLVKKLYIVFSPKYNKYKIMLSDEFGYNDDFYVSITEFPNFLKEFGLL